MLWFIQEGMACTLKEEVTTLDFATTRFDELLLHLKAEGCKTVVKDRQVWDPPFDFSDLDPQEPTILFASIETCKQYMELSKTLKLPKPGVWFNPEIQKCSSYLEQLSEFCINKDCQFIKFKDISKNWINENFPTDQKIFVRPAMNEKKSLFLGEVLERTNFQNWLQYNQGYVNPETECMISAGKNIHREWRLFINKDQKVVSGTLYKTDGKLTYKNGFSEDVKNFTETVASVWSPYPVWCLDIGETEKGLGVVELSSVNCSGWYNAELLPIIKAINEAAVN